MLARLASSAYTPLLRRTMQHPWVLTAIVVGGFASSLLLIPRLGAPLHCHSTATFTPLPCNSIALLLPLYDHSTVPLFCHSTYHSTVPPLCHFTAILLLPYCHAFATLLPFSCHCIATLLPLLGHSTGTLLPLTSNLGPRQHKSSLPQPRGPRCSAKYSQVPLSHSLSAKTTPHAGGGLGKK